MDFLNATKASEQESITCTCSVIVPGLGHFRPISSVWGQSLIEDQMFHGEWIRLDSVYA